MTTVIIVVVLLGAVYLGVRVGAAARCPHCGYVPKRMDEKVAPVCQRCGKQKRP